MSRLDDIEILCNLPSVLPIITLAHPKVFYPFAAERFLCFVEEQVQLSTLMEDIRSSGNLAVFVPTKPGTKFPQRAEDLYGVGVVAQITEMEETGDGKFRCLARGLDRVSIDRLTQEKPYFKAEISLNSPVPDFYDEEVKRLHDDVLAETKRLYAIIEHTSEEEALGNLLPYVKTCTDEASFLLACLFQLTAFSDWSEWKGKHILSLDGAFALELLTCNSDKDRYTLLKNFLDRELPLFEADNQLRSEQTNQKNEPKQAPIQHADSKSHDNDTLLGKDIKTGEAVYVSQKDRRRGMYCLGGTGMGKSKLVTSMVIQDLSQRIPIRKDFEENIGVCVIAPDSDLINDILLKIPKHREKDVVLLDPLDYEWPFPLNLFNCPDPTDPKTFELTVEQVFSVFEKVFGMSEATPLLSEYVQAITRAFVGTPYTMLEIPHLLINEGFRKQLVDPTDDFWMDYNAMRPQERKEEYRTTIRRFRELTKNLIIRNIVGQTGMLDFSEIIDKHKILLVDMAGEYEHLGKLLGSIIIGQLLLAALKQKHRPENQRPYFNLYVDEFQNYATPAMNKLLTECRKYRIGSCVLHQTLYQPGITDGIRSTTRNVSTFVFFKLANVDAEELASIFDTTPPKKELPEPTIPANVLDYLPKHPSEVVRSFYLKYTSPLEQARSKKEHLEDGVTVWPDHNFGEGNIEFVPGQVEKSRRLLQEVLYETQINNRLPTEKHIDLVVTMGYLLNYIYYLEHVNIPFDPKIGYTQKEVERLQEYTQKVEMYQKHYDAIKDDDEALLHSYFGGSGKTLEECNRNLDWQVEFHARQTRPCYFPGGYFGWVKNECYLAIAQWEKAHKHIPPPSRLKALFSRRELSTDGKGNYRKVRVDDYENQCWRYYAVVVKGILEYSYSVDDLRKALQSDETFLEFLRGDQKYKDYHTNEQLLERFAYLCGETINYAKQRDTHEKIIAHIRHEALEKLENAKYDLERYRQKIDERVALDIANVTTIHDTQMAEGKERYERFTNHLREVLRVLLTEEGKIKTYSTEWMDSPASQQTFSDKRLEIANNLTQLIQRQAMVKTPQGEWLIETPSVDGRTGGLEQKRQKALENTREKYCRPRAEVEAEIANRIRSDEPPATRRKHALS